jgi:hypothetical protein
MTVFWRERLDTPAWAKRRLSFDLGSRHSSPAKALGEILGLLQSLPTAAAITADEFLFFIDRHRLMGRELGCVDIHLMGSAHLHGVPLWTDDHCLRSAADTLGVGFSAWLPGSAQ